MSCVFRFFGNECYACSDYGVAALGLEEGHSWIPMVSGGLVCCAAFSLGSKVSCMSIITVR